MPAPTTTISDGVDDEDDVDGVDGVVMRTPCSETTVPRHARAPILSRTAPPRVSFRQPQVSALARWGNACCAPVAGGPGAGRHDRSAGQLLQHRERRAPGLLHG